MLRLRDVVKNIEAVVFFGEGTIHFFDSEDDEQNNLERDIEHDLLNSDNECLNELTREEIRSVENIELIEKIYHSQRRKDLSKEQRVRYFNELGTKMIVLREDVAYVLERLRNANWRLCVGHVNEYIDFLRKYNLTDEDMVYIINNLKVSDYSCNKRNTDYNIGKVGNNLIIFRPKNVKNRKGEIIGDFIIYIKLDIEDLFTGNTHVLISMHESEYDNALMLYSEDK